MKKRSFFLVLLLIAVNFSIAQLETNSIESITEQTNTDGDTTKTVSEQIKEDRDKQLAALNNRLQENETEILNLTTRLSAISDKNVVEKIKGMEFLQQALDKRIKFLEEEPKTRITINGTLAFSELLYMQKDIQPAALLSASSIFFNQLGNTVSLQGYSDFKNWKTEYDKWYKRQNNTDEMLGVVHNSLNLIGDAVNGVPVYGSMVQTVSSGISLLISSIGAKNRELKERTPKMLLLLNAVSQFQHQKSFIDHEWILINTELEQLQKESDQLIEDQLLYYELPKNKYITDYVEETMGTKRTKYIDDCTKLIMRKIEVLNLDANAETTKSWMTQVQIYMYKVQSLRSRFGQLGVRIISNLNEYEKLINFYSDSEKFPTEFATKLNSLRSYLNDVRGKFSSTFKPDKYIQDSATMYIEAK